MHLGMLKCATFDKKSKSVQDRRTVSVDFTFLKVLSNYGHMSYNMSLDVLYNFNMCLPCC